MLILKKLKKKKKQNRNYLRFSKFSNINHERAFGIRLFIFCFSMMIISINLSYNNNISACFVVLIAVAICYNKSINKLQHLNNLQLEHYIRYSIGLEVFDIENNYETYYKELLILKDDEIINQIPNKVVEETISLYNKKYKKNMLNKEIIDRNIKNMDYVEIINE